MRLRLGIGCVLVLAVSIAFRWTTKPGDEPSSAHRHAVLASPRTLRTTELATERTVVLSGVVEDLSGGPIGGAMVQFVDDASRAQLASVWSDEAGHYTVTLPLSEITATAEAEGYAAATLRLDLRAPVIPAGDFRLSVGGAIRGMVVAPDGARCRGAVVVAKVGLDMLRQERQAVASAAGLFELAGLQPGEVSLEAHGPGCATRDAVIIPLAAGATVEQVVITAEQASTLRGVVVDRRTRRPVPNVTLTLEQIPGGRVRSDTEGRYEIHGILPGSYELEVASPAHLVELIPVEIHHDTQRDVELDHGRVIRGRVAPASIARLELVHGERDWTDLANRRRRASATTTKSDGTFTIENVIAGALELEARSLEGTSVGSVVLAELGDQDDIVIALKPLGDRVVTGSVVEESGAPVAGCEVSVYWRADRFDRELPKVFTAADGSFRFEKLPPRELVFSVESQVPIESQNLVVTPDDPPVLRIVVRSRAAIRGRVVDGGGQAAADVPIAAMPVKPGPSAFIHAITDATGAFVLDKLPVGEYRIQATAPGGDAQAFATARTGEVVELALARSGHVELSVTRQGRPLRENYGTRCLLANPSGSLDRPSISSFASSNNARSDGRYRSDAVYPLGGVTCLVSAAAGGAVGTFEIGKPAELALTPWATIHATTTNPRAHRMFYTYGDLEPSSNAELVFARLIEAGQISYDEVFPGVGWIAIYDEDLVLLAKRRIVASPGQRLELGVID